MVTTEQDVRLNILNSLLNSTHRDVQQVAATHQDMIEQDPEFYGHLAVWAQKNTHVRDHKEMFVASLLLSEFPEHREAGYVLLQNFPPYQVERIKNHVKKVFKSNPPRIMKSAVKRYLKSFESDMDRLDSAAASRNGKSLTGLYASFKIKPSDFAQQLLFDNNPPENSKLFQVRQLALSDDPAEQARLIVKHNISYTTAVGALKNMTPTVLAALINQMSDQEILVNLGSLQKRGVMDNPDLKKLVQSKLKKAKSSKRVDALKATKAAKTSGVDSDMASDLTDISDAQLKRVAEIPMSTALVIDKSQSMRVAIDIGMELGSMISTVVKGDFYCWVFDTGAQEKTVKSNSLEEWQKKFAMVKAGCSTSCGAAIDRMARKGQSVEQIIMITDQGENTSPTFEQAMDTYNSKMGFYPRVVFVTCGHYRSSRLVDVCRRRGWDHENFDIPKGADYYSLPNLLPLISKPGRLDLLDEILSLDLPTRASLDKNKKIRLVQ